MTPIASQPADPHNYSSRCGMGIDLVVIHTMEGHFLPTIRLFAEPGFGRSAHYCVSAQGDIAQCVTDDYAAWHSGNREYNHRSIGIELEGFAADPRPLAQVDALASLVAWLCTTHGIPLDRSHVIGHCEVPDPRDPRFFGGAEHHHDPGPGFPWTLVMQQAAQT